MPDITMCRDGMCNSDVCKRRDSCYRYKAVPDVLQSYADFVEDCKQHDYRN